MCGRSVKSFRFFRNCYNQCKICCKDKIKWCLNPWMPLYQWHFLATNLYTQFVQQVESLELSVCSTSIASADRQVTKKINITSVVHLNLQVVPLRPAICNLIGSQTNTPIKHIIASNLSWFHHFSLLCTNTTFLLSSLDTVK